MSILTEITRLQTAKSDIASAITAKGGTVNSGDGFSDFAADIGTIPTGGSAPLPSNITAIDGGSFTLASDTSINAYPLYHSIGAVPNFFMIYTETSNITVGNPSYYCIISGYFFAYPFSGSNTVRANGVSTVISPSNVISCGFAYAPISNMFYSDRVAWGTSDRLKAGVNYRWACGVLA